MEMFQNGSLIKSRLLEDPKQPNAHTYMHTYSLNLSAHLIQLHNLLL